MGLNLYSEVFAGLNYLLHNVAVSGVLVNLHLLLVGSPLFHNIGVDLFLNFFLDLSLPLVFEALKCSDGLFLLAQEKQLLVELRSVRKIFVFVHTFAHLLELDLRFETVFLQVFVELL